MECIITRHGETDYNTKRLVHGQRQSRLTQRGVLQVKALAQQLKDTPIEAIYTSTLSRSLKTADAINAFHDVPLYSLRALNERSFGALEGKTGTSILKKFPHAFS